MRNVAFSNSQFASISQKWRILLSPHATPAVVNHDHKLIFIGTTSKKLEGLKYEVCRDTCIFA